MTDSLTILDGFAPEDEWAEANEITPRTCARYRNRPDGLPFVRFGGRVFIDVAGAREWLRKRIVRRNPTRRAA